MDGIDGKKISEILNQHNVQNPLLKNQRIISSEEKINIIKDNIKNILTTLGLDTSDPSIVDTPKRVAEMYVNEIFSGL